MQPRNLHGWMEFFWDFEEEAKRRWDRKMLMEQNVGRGTFTLSHADVAKVSAGIVRQPKCTERGLRDHQ